MKTKSILFICLFSIIAFVACDKEEKNNAPDSLYVTYAPRADDVLVAQSNFNGREPYEVEGGVKVYKNSFHHVLRFEDFKVDNGPEMAVYLSADDSTIDNHIYIGELKAVSGSFNYTFSVNTDIGIYQYVIVRSNGNNSNYCWTKF